MKQVIFKSLYKQAVARPPSLSPEILTFFSCHKFCTFTVG